MAASMEKYALNVSVKCGPKVLVDLIGAFDQDSSLIDIFRTLPESKELIVNHVEVAKTPAGPWRTVSESETC